MTCKLKISSPAELDSSPNSYNPEQNFVHDGFLRLWRKRITFTIDGFSVVFLWSTACFISLLASQCALRIYLPHMINIETEVWQSQTPRERENFFYLKIIQLEPQALHENRSNLTQHRSPRVHATSQKAQQPL